MQSSQVMKAAQSVENSYGRVTADLMDRYLPNHMEAPATTSPSSPSSSDTPSATTTAAGSGSEKKEAEA